MDPASPPTTAAEPSNRFEGTELIIFGADVSGEKCNADANRQPNSGGSFRRVGSDLDLAEEGRKIGKRLDDFLK